MNLEILDRGIEPYQVSWEAMRQQTDQRTPVSPDALWIVEHPAVFTLGQAGKEEHLLNPATKIPVIRSDRGGQITFHGPGQIVCYLLLDLRRRNMHVRALVDLAEQAIIQTLKTLDIEASTQPKAPGVYVDGRKIASLGFRIRRGCSYHGLALNVAMDLDPFYAINPCGYKGLIMTDVERELKQKTDDTTALMNYCRRSLLQSITELLAAR